LIERVNALPIRFRAAVDLPSAGLVRADFTYCTGSVKRPALNEIGGRIRYLDLGFFSGRVESEEPSRDQVVRPSILDPLRNFRPAHSDKRTYGNVFLIGGSRGYPGAIKMAAMAALRSGAGLVTAFLPESLVPAYAARTPEVMWVGWPETPDGGLALEGQHLLRARLSRASSLVIGPGLGREPEVLALVRDMVETSLVPLVLDADALQPEIVRAGKAPRLLTPHAGEFLRIAGDADLRKFASATGATVVLKGPITRVCAGDPVFHSFHGGPVLARGGSGDVLAGLIGGLLAQTPAEPLLAAIRGVVWHGLAADALARAHGETSVEVTQLLEFLPRVLREK
jgi:NAD(P)H-hydrate epimerase